MKYMIVPKFPLVSNKIEAWNAEKALAAFTANMGTDMSEYFEVIEADKYDDYMNRIQSKMYDEHVISFMQGEFKNAFEVEDEEVARGLAELAYDKYCDGDGETEYECIELIWDEYQNGEYDEEDFH